MKLNKLQRAQLADCIKSGRTPKINLKAKEGEQKGWSDTPIFKQHEEEKQTKLF